MTCSGSICCKIPMVNFTLVKPTTFTFAWPTTTAPINSRGNSRAKTDLGFSFGAKRIQTVLPQCNASGKSSHGNRPELFENASCLELSSSVVKSRPAGVRVLFQEPFDAMFSVYILRNQEGKFHIGQTESLDVRVAKHNRTDELGGKQSGAPTSE